MNTDIQQEQIQNEEQEVPQILYIKALTGAVYQINFDPNDTIEDVKHQITNVTGIPFDSIRLIYAGKRLEDCRRNSDYGVVNQGTMHMVLRLRGASSQNECQSYDGPQGNYNSCKNVNFPKELDFSLSEETSQDITILSSSVESNNMLSKFLSEMLSFSKDCGIILGELSIDMFGIRQTISEIVYDKILPLYSTSNPNIKIKPKYDILGTIFHEGDKGLDQLELNLPKENFNTGFPSHIDDSEITINLCLGGEFSNSQLKFGNGMVYNHKPGNIVIHSGNMEHSATPCQGERYNMLLFLK